MAPYGYRQTPSAGRPQARIITVLAPNLLNVDNFLADCCTEHPIGVR
jgi:hypothetical protein